MSRIPRGPAFRQIPEQTQIPPNAGPRQTQERSRVPTQIPATDSVQDQLQAQNEHLNAQAAVLLNEFQSKTRRIVASELENDSICTICSEPFLRGENPEVPVRLDCGHVFGMNCILKWLSPVSCNGRNSCPICRKPVFDDWDNMDFPASRQTVPARNMVAAGPILPPVPNPFAQTAPTSGPLVMVDPVNAHRYGQGPPNSPRAAPLPAGFPRAFRTRRVDPTADTAETANATANTSSVGSTTEPVATNTPLLPWLVTSPVATTTEPVAPSTSEPPWLVRSSVAATTEPVAPNTPLPSWLVRSSVTTTAEPVAPSTPLPPWLVTTEEASYRQQPAQRPQTVATYESWPTEMPRSNHMPLPGPSTQRRAPIADSTSRWREWDNARVNLDLLQTLRQTDLEVEIEAPAFAQVAARRPARGPAVATAATPASAEAAGPTEDEYNGVAAMFNNAEDGHNRQRQLEATKERKRHMWMQFCEGVVRYIEQSSDSTAFTNHDLVLTIINMKDLDEFMAERATASPTWRRILHTFPRLHTEMVTRFEDFRPLPSVNIDNRLELEHLLASTRINTEMLHKARWHTRVSERLALGAAASNHEAAVARLTERVASLAGPSRETTAFTSRSYERPTSEEARETRRMEDYLLGRTPMTVRREAAVSVDAALRAGAESNLATTRVLRL